MTPRWIGLSSDTDATRIRTRAGRDKVYNRQLNLDDLLDTAISILPEDAYALLMIVHHDLYENSEDDWTCGRAYGGSRVAVVSTARYNPLLDHLMIHWVHEVPQHHAWPASHCDAYIQERCCPPSSKPAGKDFLLTMLFSSPFLSSRCGFSWCIGWGLLNIVRTRIRMAIFMCGFPSFHRIITNIEARRYVSLNIVTYSPIIYFSATTAPSIKASTKAPCSTFPLPGCSTKSEFALARLPTLELRCPTPSRPVLVAYSRPSERDADTMAR